MSTKTKILNVHADSPDLRDRIYNPTLRLLGKTYNAQPFADEAWASRIKDQGETSACTGFALASLVEALVSKASSAGEKGDAKLAQHLAVHALFFRAQVRRDPGRCCR